MRDWLTEQSFIWYFMNWIFSDSESNLLGTVFDGAHPVNGMYPSANRLCVHVLSDFYLVAVLDKQ